jgi:histidine triad (HIT) family protein
VSLYGVYDSNNVFARILRGELPCYRVYENTETLAFLDLFPQSRGHTLVIPKRGTARNLLEVDPANLVHLMAAVQKIARAVVSVLEPDGVQIFQFNGGLGGQSVYHIHVHIVPRWPGQPLGLHGQKKGDPKELESLARLISAKLSEADGAG